MKQSSVAFLIPYFGKWPDWMDIYIDSIERNATIDFHFITDCDAEITNASNVFFHPTTFEAYIKLAQEKIGAEINIPDAYKVCDLRPFFGIIHEDIIANYDFFGWTDIDLLFGDIRSFYTDDILNSHDVLSSQEVRLSGHCSLLRNSEKYKTIGYQIYNWQGALNNPLFIGIDEHGMTNALCMTFWDKLSEKVNMPWIASLFAWRRKKKMKPYYFKEQYTTPFIPLPWLDGSVNSDQPAEWYYEKGIVTNERDERDFMYIHFMNFKSSKWRHDGTKAPWEEKNTIFTRDETKSLDKIVINKDGISNQ